jgi:hypothetical protein
MHINKNNVKLRQTLINHLKSIIAWSNLYIITLFNKFYQVEIMQ